MNKRDKKQLITMAIAFLATDVLLFVTRIIDKELFFGSFLFAASCIIVPIVFIKILTILFNLCRYILSFIWKYIKAPVRNTISLLIYKPLNFLKICARKIWNKLVEYSKFTFQLLIVLLQLVILILIIAGFFEILNFILPDCSGILNPDHVHFERY